MAKKKGLRLVAKFNLLTLALISATSLSIGAFVIHNELQDNYEQLVRHGASIAAMTAQSGEYALYTENQEALQRIVESVSVHPEIVSVRILNQEKNTLIEKPTPSLLFIPPSLPYVPVSPEQTVLFADFFAERDGAPYTVILAPVLTNSQSTGAALFLTLEAPESARTIGYIQLALSHQGLMDRRWEFLVSISAFTSLLILVGVTITVMMTRRLAAPLRTLARVTREISTGKLDQQIQVATRDELSELATAFNWMIERLRDYRREVASAQQTLEARVRQRTIELQKTTEHAYALAHQAEAASRAKSQFLANITHELRTPVHGVLGMIELLLTTSLDAKQRRFAETAYRSGQGLLSLINDVLDFSKIEAGKLDLELLDFDLGALVEQTIDMLAEYAHRKGAKETLTMTSLVVRRQMSLVLVVDDEPSMRLLMREALEQAGFAVEEAADGVQALAAFIRLQPDLVLLDVMMPTLDGFAVCRALRSLPGGEYTPVLMVTGLDNLDSIHLAYQVGATDFITKPIAWPTLGYHVRYMMRASRALAELQASEEALRQEAQVSSALVRVGREITSSLDAPAILGRLCQLTAEVLECDCSHTFLWQPQAQGYVAVASWGDSADQQETLAALTIPPRLWLTWSSISRKKRSCNVRRPSRTGCFLPSCSVTWG